MKIIFVDTCSKCPFFKTRGSSAAALYFCAKRLWDITDIGSTPNWCPLLTGVHYPTPPNKPIQRMGKSLWAMIKKHVWKLLIGYLDNFRR